MSSTHANSELVCLPRLHIHDPSVVVYDGVEFGLARTDVGDRLAVLALAGSPHLAGLVGDISESMGRTLLLAPLSANNATILRTRLAWLQPRTIGLRTSVGLGDRLGVATPGHVRAIRAAGGDLAPIFAQQSIREMERTGRTPQCVIDDAMWGVFAEGWRGGFGADADHLKTSADIDRCVASGYTFYTIDPGEYVENVREGVQLSSLRAALDALPWEQLGDTPQALLRRYLGRSYSIEGQTINFDEHALLRAAVKYGAAIAHVSSMYQHLVRAAGNSDWEVEVSVDETESPTTHGEHVYIASELHRLGVQWVSLAPRYVGQFEKGVDYIGDIDLFEADFAVHAAIARHFGPYKLSLHTGSDKFSIYETVVRHAGGFVHLKTAGTSYLEALRTLAVLAPRFFREVYTFARQRYETDRASYHVSASLEKTPLPDAVVDSELSTLLEQFDARQILHVTFGSVLGAPRFRERLMNLLRDHPDAYAANLEAHFARHLAPFATVRST